MVPGRYAATAPGPTVRIPGTGLRTIVLVTALTASACFQQPTLSERLDAAPHALQLWDVEGAPFTPAEAPRDVTLGLTFSAPPAAQAEQWLLLVRGVFTPAFITRLSAVRLRNATRDRAVPLAFARAGAELQVRPERALEPGAPYTLLWAAPEDPRAFPLTISRSPALGARLVESWPGAGEANAPPNLARALLRFDGHLSGDLMAHIQWRDGVGRPLPIAVERAACAGLGLPAGDCVWLTPLAALTAGAHTLAVTPGLRALTGAALAPAEVSFTLGELEDHSPPSWSSGPCASDASRVGALCVRSDDAAFSARGALDEAAWVSLTALGSELPSVSMLSYADSFELAISPPQGTSAVLLRALDLAGNAREELIPIELASALATVAIDEVRSDPLGREPAQEYVELLNFGQRAVALMGFRLSKDEFETGRALAGAPELASGERALLVGPDFDPHELSDGALPGGLKLLRVDGALGLANAGERLFLRDAEGRRLSSARALPPLLEGQCSARIASDPRGDARDAFELDPDGGCTPGAPTFAAP